jgi:hypothetical protein
VPAEPQALRVRRPAAAIRTGTRRATLTSMPVIETLASSDSEREATNPSTRGTVGAGVGATRQGTDLDQEQDCEHDCDRHHNPDQHRDPSKPTEKALVEHVQSNDVNAGRECGYEYEPVATVVVPAVMAIDSQAGVLAKFADWPKHT